MSRVRARSHASDLGTTRGTSGWDRPMASTWRGERMVRSSRCQRAARPPRRRRRSAQRRIACLSRKIGMRGGARFVRAPASTRSTRNGNRGVLAIETATSGGAEATCAASRASGARDSFEIETSQQPCGFMRAASSAGAPLSCRAALQQQWSRTLPSMRHAYAAHADWKPTITISGSTAVASRERRGRFTSQFCRCEGKLQGVRRIGTEPGGYDASSPWVSASPGAAGGGVAWVSRARGSSGAPTSM